MLLYHTSQLIVTLLVISPKKNPYSRGKIYQTAVAIQSNEKIEFQKQPDYFPTPKRD